MAERKVNRDDMLKRKQSKAAKAAKIRIRTQQRSGKCIRCKNCCRDAYMKHCEHCGNEPRFLYPIVKRKCVGSMEDFTNLINDFFTSFLEDNKKIALSRIVSAMIDLKIIPKYLERNTDLHELIFLHIQRKFLPQILAPLYLQGDFILKDLERINEAIKEKKAELLKEAGIDIEHWKRQNEYKRDFGIND